MDSIHWKHLQDAARRHSGVRNERMCVMGQRIPAPFGPPTWHYLIVDASSAARMRSFRASIERALP